MLPTHQHLHGGGERNICAVVGKMAHLSNVEFKLVVFTIVELCSAVSQLESV